MSMDYENLANILIKNQSVSVLYDLFKRKEMKKRNKNNAIMASFTESLRMNELAISVKIWHDYEYILTKESMINKVLHAIV